MDVPPPRPTLLTYKRQYTQTYIRGGCHPHISFNYIEMEIHSRGGVTINQTPFPKE